MSHSVTSTLTTNLSIARQQTETQLTISDQSNVKATADFNFGTGFQQINSSHRSSGNILAGSTIGIDFLDLQQVIFGNTTTLNLNGQKVKGILIANTSTNGIFTVVATGVAGLTDVFGGPSGIRVPPNSSMNFVDYSGISVSDGGASKLYLKDAGGGSDYDLAVVCVTGL